MILRKYNALIVSGRFDPYLLFNRLDKIYNNVKYYNQLEKTYIGAPNSNKIDKKLK